MSSKVLFVLWCLACREVYSHSTDTFNHKVNGRHLTLLGRGDCQTNPDWQETQSAWIRDNTDTKLASWWQNTSTKPYQSFANSLGEGFGAHLNGFRCGIGEYSTCISPSCSDYQNNNDPPWAYLSILSVVNLDTFFNALYTGISNGQSDYHALTNEIATTFFPWSPDFVLGDAVFWITALLTALFAIPSGLIDLGVEIGVISVGVGAFVSAGVQQLSQSLQPVSTESQGLAQLDAYAEQIGISSRQSVETWAEATFKGEKDVLNKTILDYIHNGSFTSGNLPTFTEIELFYKQQMISRTINAQWSTQKIFLMFFRTNDSCDTSGPNETRYYSEADGGVYYLYRYQEDGILRGHLDMPWGLDQLNKSDYGINGHGINGSDITKASARAFRIGGFNYTSSIEQDRIISSLSSNGTLTPFADGPGWEGTWTLPVCDTGSRNWNSQYGDSASRYGKLPCCCGENCQNTSAFVKAANMENFQTLLHGCQEQLAGSNVDFEQIDYGFGWKHSFPITWATLSIGQRAGVGIGIIFAVFLLLVGILLIGYIIEDLIDYYESH